MILNKEIQRLHNMQLCFYFSLVCWYEWRRWGCMSECVLNMYLTFVFLWGGFLDIHVHVLWESMFESVNYLGN